MTTRREILGGLGALSIPLIGKSEPIRSMLGAVETEGESSSLPTASDYIQDGLIALWDAIENGGWGVHEASPSKWKDLTGHGYDFTMTTNWAIWGDDYVTRKSGVNGAAGSAQVPVSAWMFFDGCLESSNGHAVDLGYPTANREIFAMSSRSRIFLNGNSTWIGFSAYNTISVSYGSNGVATAAYLDGVDKSLSSGGSYYSAMNGSTEGVIRLGHGNNAWGYTGKYRSLRLYSRALSADEIAYNYSIDKTRFNLP